MLPHLAIAVLYLEYFVDSTERDSLLAVELVDVDLPAVGVGGGEAVYQKQPKPHDLQRAHEIQSIEE